MIDTEELERLATFGVRHGRCGEQAVSAEFLEDDGTDHIQVIKRCQTCNAEAAATVTRRSAAALLRQ